MENTGQWSIMRTLLENDFVRHFGKQVGSVPLPIRQVSGTNRLYDPVACRQCLDFFRLHCPHETFVMNSMDAVNVVDYESYIDNLQLEGEKCDLMLFDADKVALVDFTCTMEHYLGAHRVNGAPCQGKRMKSRSQLARSIERLCAVPTLAAHIGGMAQRDAVLAYRVKDEDLFRSVPMEIEKTEQVWQELARQRESRKLTMPMSDGFVFRMVRYPDVYQW